MATQDWQTHRAMTGSSDEVTAVVGRKRHRRQVRTAWTTHLGRVLWLEPLWIVLLAPSLLFPGRFWISSWQPALVVLFFVFWPLRLGLRRVSVPHLFGLPVACLMAAVAWALAVSPAPAASWEAAGYLLLGVALALALVQWPPIMHQPGVAAGLVLAAGCSLAVVGPLLLGAMPFKFGLGALIPAAGRLGGALSETVNPNVLGGALVIPFLLAAALALGPRYSKQPWRLVWALVSVALLIVLLLTQCRGAYLGAAGGMALLLILRWPRVAWVMVPVGLVGVGWLISGMGLSLIFDTMGGAAQQNGLSGRLAIWQFAVQVAAVSPLHGAGLGLFAALQPGTTPAPHAHNLLLQVTMDLGVLGIAAYCAVLAGVAAMLVRVLRRRPPMQRRRHSSTSSRRSAVRLATAYAETGRTPAAQHLSVSEVYRRRLCWTLALGASSALAGLLADAGAARVTRRPRRAMR